MPQRQVTRRIETPEIQGEDSWIALRPMTVGEALALQQDAEKIPGLKERFIAFVKRLFRIRENAHPRSRAYELSMRRILAFVADWNWVDDRGEPLPNPRQNPDVVKLLTNTEVLALAKIIYGPKQEADIKN